MAKLSPKIIALDLDDTLLTESLTVSPYTVEVLEETAKRGVYIALNSGRSAGAMLPTLRLLGPVTEQRRYLLTQNGAVVWDVQKAENILDVRVDSDVLLAAWEVGKQAGMSFQVYDADTIYSPERTKWTEEDRRLSGLHFQVVPDYGAWLKKGWPKMVLSTDAEVMEKAESRLRSVLGDRATVFLSKPYFLEVMPKNAGKGEGLLYLAEKLGIPAAETMAFGDSMNDESMIRLAGFGVAMKNARQAIRDIADYVTDYTNNEDGIARFLEKYVL